MISPSIYWEKARGHYRARFRDEDFEKKERIPDLIFLSVGLDIPKKPSQRHDMIARKWADRRALELERERTRGAAMTLRQVFDLYLKENPRGVKEATVAKYRVDFRNLAKTIGETTLPDRIDDAFATQHRNRRRNEKARERTIWNELSFLKQILTFAYRWKRVTGMRSLNLHELPTVEDEESDAVALTEEEFRKLLTTRYSFPADRGRRWLTFAVTTMLRRDNVVGLRKEWIDRSARWIRIPGEHMKEGRTHEMPLCDTALATLPEWTEGETGYVWPNLETGLPYTRLFDLFSKMSAEAEVPPFSMHDMRTTGASWLNRHGVDEYTRAVLLGHAVGTVTQLYTKLFRDQLVAAVSVFDKVLIEHVPQAWTGPQVDQNHVTH